MITMKRCWGVICLIIITALPFARSQTQSCGPGSCDTCWSGTADCYASSSSPLSTGGCDTGTTTRVSGCISINSGTPWGPLMETGVLSSQGHHDYVSCEMCNFNNLNPGCACCNGVITTATSGATWDGFMKCSTCKSGWNLDSTGKCYQCSAIQAHCTACSSPTTCTACDPNSGYYLSGGTCVVCPSQCTKCTSSSQCTACSAGYYLSGSSCLSCSSAIPQCTACNSATQCTACNSPYVVTPGGASCETCSAAMSGCTACTSATVCTSCVSGDYVTSSNTCGQCSTAFSNCMTCTATGCTSCATGYAVTQFGTCESCEATFQGCNTCTSSGCITCDQGWFHNGQGCSLCQGGTCNTCDSSSGQCTSCYSGEYLMNGQCFQCDISCTTCTASTNGGTCTACSNPNGYVSSSTGHCLDCQSTTNCKTCAFNGGACTSCDPSGGFPILSSGNCLACTSPCATCSGSTTSCTSCIGNYYLSGSTCLTCGSANCATCNSGGCLTCPSGYTMSGNVCIACASLCMTCLSSNTAHCTSCWPYNTITAGQGYYLTSSFTCAPCTTPPCVTCQGSANFCTACTDFSTYISNGQCIPCSTHCSLCTSATDCTACVRGYGFDGSGNCSPCPANCFSCTNSSSCDFCLANTTPVGGQCIPCNIANCASCAVANVCNACQSPYYLTGSNTCAICPHDCSCSTTGVVCFSCASSFCQECSDPTSDTSCLVCNDGLPLRNGVCCGDLHCQTCNGAITGSPAPCLQCMPGYYLIGADCCPDTCAGCTFGTGVVAVPQCTACKAGFQMTGAGPGARCCPIHQKCFSGTLNIQMISILSLTASSDTVQEISVLTATDGNELEVACVEIQTNWGSNNVTNGALILSPTDVSGTSNQQFGVLVNPGTTANSISSLFPMTFTVIQPSAVCTPVSVTFSNCPTVGYFQSATACTACPANCSDCSVDPSVCIECLPGFTLSGTTCIAITCAEHCATCSLTNPCLTCVNGYYYTSSQTCAACSSNCATCETSPSTCTSCATGSYLSNNICNLCDSSGAGCTTCVASPTTCTSCVLGKYLTPTHSCLPCDPSCTYCIGSSTTCAGCDSSGKNCVPCFNGTINEISVIAQEYYYNPYGLITINLFGSYVSGVTLNLTLPHDISVLLPPTDSFGVTTYETYDENYLNGFIYPNTISVANQLGCPAISTTITQCQGMLSLSSASCLPCPIDKCLYCRAEFPGLCEQCYPGYWIHNTPNGYCDLCFGIDTCLPCFSGTINGTSLITLDGNGCPSLHVQLIGTNPAGQFVSIGSETQQTDSTGVATFTRCGSHFAYPYTVSVQEPGCPNVPTPIVVPTCIGDTSLGQCIPCTNPLCYVCNTAPNSCDICQPGYVLTGPNTCTACDPNCVTCAGATTNCTSCLSNQFLSHGVCGNCDPACNGCNGPTPSQCKACASGYRVFSGACVISGCDCGSWWSPPINDLAPSALVGASDCGVLGYVPNPAGFCSISLTGDSICSFRPTSSVPLCPIECPWGTQPTAEPGTGRSLCCVNPAACSSASPLDCALGKATASLPSCPPNVLQAYTGNVNQAGTFIIPSLSQAFELCHADIECFGFTLFDKFIYFYRRLADFNQLISYQPYGVPPAERAAHSTLFVHIDVSVDTAVTYSLERAFGFGTNCPYAKFDYAYYAASGGGLSYAQTFIEPFAIYPPPLVPSFSSWKEDSTTLSMYNKLPPLNSRLPLFGASSTSAFAGLVVQCNQTLVVYYPAGQHSLIGWVSVYPTVNSILFVNNNYVTAAQSYPDGVCDYNVLSPDITTQKDVSAYNVLGYMMYLHWAGKRSEAQQRPIVANISSMFGAGLLLRLDASPSCLFTTNSLYLPAVPSLPLQCTAANARCSYPDNPAAWAVCLDQTRSPNERNALGCSQFNCQLDAMNNYVCKTPNMPPCNGRGMCLLGLPGFGPYCSCDFGWTVWEPMASTLINTSLSVWDYTSVFHNDGCAFPTTNCLDTTDGLNIPCSYPNGMCTVSVLLPPDKNVRQAECLCMNYPPDATGKACNLYPYSCQTLNPVTHQPLLAQFTGWSNNVVAGFHAICEVPAAGCYFPGAQSLGQFRRNYLDLSTFYPPLDSAGCTLPPDDYLHLGKWGNCLNTDNTTVTGYSCAGNCNPGYYGPYCQFVSIMGGCMTCTHPPCTTTMCKRCQSIAPDGKTCLQTGDYWGDGTRRAKYVPCWSGDPNFATECIYPCAGEICSGNGQCTSTRNPVASGLADVSLSSEDYQFCKCNTNWNGTLCQTQICQPPCAAGGQCQFPTGGGTPFCLCDKDMNGRPAFAGADCSIPLFACPGSPAGVPPCANNLLNIATYYKNTTTGLWQATCVPPWNSNNIGGGSFTYGWCTERGCTPNPQCYNVTNAFVGVPKGISCPSNSITFIDTCTCNDINPTTIPQTQLVFLPGSTPTAPSAICQDICGFYQIPQRGVWNGVSCTCNHQIMATGTFCNATNCGVGGNVTYVFNVTSGQQQAICQCADPKMDPSTFCQHCYDGDGPDQLHYYLSPTTSRCTTCNCNQSHTLTCGALYVSPCPNTIPITQCPAVPGYCICQTGWANPLGYVANSGPPGCNVCAPKFFGSNCSPCTCTARQTCSDGLTGTGACSCPANTFGPTCAACPSCPSGCHCSQGITGTGQCICTGGGGSSSSSGSSSHGTSTGTHTTSSSSSTGTSHTTPSSSSSGSHSTSSTAHSSSSTATTHPPPPSSSSSSSNLPLILGLALGLGIPVLVAVLIILLLYFQVIKNDYLWTKQQPLPKSKPRSNSSSSLLRKEQGTSSEKAPLFQWA